MRGLHTHFPPHEPYIVANVLEACIIGERERANLVVQLARFFYIYIYISRSLRAPIPNKRNVHVILQCWISDLGETAEAHAHSPEICHIHRRRSFFTVCSLLLLMASEHPIYSQHGKRGWDHPFNSQSHSP